MALNPGKWRKSVELNQKPAMNRSWKVYIFYLGGDMRQYCDVPGSPCLSKTGPVYGPFFFLVHLWTDQRIPGPVSCCCLEPGWFVGDPTPLARDNIYVPRLIRNWFLITLHSFIAYSRISGFQQPCYNHVAAWLCTLTFTRRLTLILYSPGHIVSDAKAKCQWWCDNMFFTCNMLSPKLHFT